MAVSGCAHRPDPAKVFGQSYEIDDVTLKGVTVFSKARLLKHLHVGETRWVPFSPDYHFDEAVLPVDVQRIESLYAAHGYHQARVMDVDVQWDHPDDEVDLVITVQEGPPTLLDGLLFRWAEGTSLDPSARKVIEGYSSLKEGAPFEVQHLNGTLGTLRLALQSWGYPLAQVRGTAEVSPGAHKARVQVDLKPGPYARVRGVVLEGLQAVPEDLVQVELSFAQGYGFTPGIAQAVGKVARGMDVFRWVTVRPADEVKDGEVDLLVRVSEADPQSLRLGVQGSFEAARWEQLLVGRYTHTNLLGRLLRLDFDLVAGWAELPDALSPEAHGPVLKLVPSFRKKGWGEDHLQWLLRPSYQVGIQPGYQFHAPATAFGVARWLGRRVHVETTYNVRFVDFFSVAPELDGTSSLLGRDFRDPYLLSYLHLGVDLNFADSLMAPKNGALLGAVYEFAGGPLAGDFDYHKLVATWRGFWRPWSRFQTAARLRTGLIVGHGSENPVAPIDRKFYLGGASSVRAWGTRKLSPRLNACSAERECDDSIPIGGTTMVQGNLELRLRAVGALWVVGFVDLGDVQAEELTYKTDEWNYTAGPGLRYDSPLGLVRLDVGFRLNDPGVYTDIPTWGMHFGFGETF
jgi:outer membrane protein assembly factor BamA